MNKDRVAVAMSGGVDSTVAAWLALREGAEVTGIHLNLYPGAPADEELRRSCAAMGIRLVERECSEEFFRRVLLPSAREYDRGRTPNPCCLCNKVLKFAQLFSAADELGIRRVLTGHYVRLEQSGGRFLLRRGADERKDQSYFLYRLDQEDLARVGFPLGGLAKEEVRRIAESAGLPCASRRDSQDACFQVPGECCGETLRRRCMLPVRGGEFIHRGRAVGRHEGIHRYTVGQRKGLKVALGVPAYVRAIDPESGRIDLTVDADELLTGSFTVKEVVWQSGAAPVGEMLSVRVRYRSPGAACSWELLPGGAVRVHPLRPLRAVTPGQAAVFYCGDVLAGGGIIDHV